MATPVNLNRYRKDKLRAEKKARADENAVKFGRTKTEKNRDAKTSEMHLKTLDDHKRET